MTGTRTRLAGLGATLLICLFVIGTPLLLLAIGAVPWREDLRTVGSLLTSPDDGTLALLVVGVVAWTAWAFMTVLFGVEILAAARGVGAPRLPGLGLPQSVAGHVVAVAALLFVAAPAAVPAFAPQQAHAAPPPEAVPAALTEDAASEPRAPAKEAENVEEGVPQATVEYTVRRGDSLWKIAEERLGDGTRFREIVALNEEVLHGRPNFIDPGVVLQLPSESGSAGEPTDTHTVEPGDTLWDLAENRLGDGARYPEIFEASRDTEQPGGQRLTDPDLILPGWNLTIPRDTATPPPATDPPPAEPDNDPDTKPDDEPEVEPSAPDHTDPESPHTQSPVAVGDPEQDQATDPSPGWLVPGLAGGGSLVAAGLFVALRRHQRTQLRFRRPGTVIKPPPESLSPVEKTLRVVGSASTSRVEALDTALRLIERNGDGVPDVIAVELATDTATLHLAPRDEAVTLPEPWTGTGRARTAHLNGGPLGEPDEHPPPYPLLVSVGQASDGTLWLLNLGKSTHVAITGDASLGEDLLRHMAAELALNPWSAEVDIDTFGLSPALTDLDPLRLHHHDDTDMLDKLAADLNQPGLPGLDPERQRALILESTHSMTDAGRAIAAASSGAAARGVAVVTMSEPVSTNSLAMNVDTSGQLTIPALGVAVETSGLSEEEVASCAAILDLTRRTDLAPVPVNGSASGRDRFVDMAGALRPNLVEARPSSAAGDTALLPRATDEYPNTAATTPEDVELLAPVTPETTRSAVEEGDPSLDQDVALWFDANCPVPRLSVLGPVRADAHGDATAVASRKPFYTELLAFLALHPEGVTSGQIVEAFSITSKRARVDMNAVRTWLGANPRTGEPHLPTAEKSRAAKERGGYYYQVEDVLLDADLFRRLRARGQARGAEGMSDLATALRLVTGQPFDQTRTEGWTWLLDGDRLDHILTCAVVDVAHIVTTHALSEGDLALAREASETAHRAAPYDEIASLDLVAVASAEGHENLADDLLRDRIYNRSDDDLGPVELPERTKERLRRRSVSSAHKHS